MVHEKMKHLYNFLDVLNICFHCVELHSEYTVLCFLILPQGSTVFSLSSWFLSLLWRFISVIFPTSKSLASANLQGKCDCVVKRKIGLQTAPTQWKFHQAFFLDQLNQTWKSHYNLKFTVAETNIEDWEDLKHKSPFLSLPHGLPSFLTPHAFFPWHALEVLAHTFLCRAFLAAKDPRAHSVQPLSCKGGVAKNEGWERKPE